MRDMNALRRSNPSQSATPNTRWIHGPYETKLRLLTCLQILQTNEPVNLTVRAPQIPAMLTTRCSICLNIFNELPMCPDLQVVWREDGDEMRKFPSRRAAVG